MQWEPLRSSVRWMTLAIALGGCASSSDDARDYTCLQPGEEQDLDLLLKQRQRAGKKETAFAEEFVALGDKYTTRATKLEDHWGGVAKSYGDALLCYPTVDALLGLAHAYAMLDRTPPIDEPDALGIKTKDMRKAVTFYRLAIELSRYTGESVPNDVPAKIQCLETFLANPEPARPPCQLVDDALRVSQIAGEPRRFYNHNVED